MTKKSRKGVEKTKTILDKPKLDLATTLTAIDKKDYSYYDNLSDDMKKLYTPFVLMRFISSATNSGGLHEFHIQMINDYVNTDFWSISKYPDFQHMLLCLCGTGTKQYHKWIPSKNERKEKWIDLIKESNPNINKDEINILRKIYTNDDIFNLAIRSGKSDKEAKDYAKSFKEKE
jgi:hypothetical protein